MEQKKILRIIDANFNRLREGIRVLEESERLGRNKAGSSAKLKSLRHDVAKCYLLFSEKELLSARDSESDVGRDGVTKTEMHRSCLNDILTANFKRCEEAARVLEEFSKIVCPEASIKAKELRFKLYTMEKNWVKR